MSKIKRTAAVLFAVVMMASSVQFSDYRGYVHAEDSVSYYQDYYNNNKGNIKIRNTTVDNALKTAEEDNQDNDYLMIKNIMNNAGISAEQQQMVLGKGWSDDLAAEVLFTEILLSSDFIGVTGKIYEQEYNRLIDTVVASLNKNGGNADRNSIYQITEASFNKYFGNYITPSQLKDLKNKYSGKEYYDACAAYTAYKWTRDTVVNMMKKFAAYIPESDKSNSIASFMSAMSTSSTGVSVASFSKVSKVPAISDGADRAKAEEYAQTFLTDYIDGKCVMLGILMPRFEMSMHKDINFFSEVNNKYNCDVDSRAEERNLLLRTYEIYSYAADAVNDENGLSADLMSSGTEKSAELYECGLEFFIKAADKMLDHLMDYSAVKIIKDGSFEDAPMIVAAMDEKSKLAYIRESAMGIPVSAKNVLAFTGPADLFLNNNQGDEIANVVGGKVNDIVPDMHHYLNYVNLGIKDRESGTVAVYSSGSKIKIQASDNGKINIDLSDAKSKEEPGFKDIPVSKGDVLIIDGLTLKNTTTGQIYGQQQPPETTTPVPVTTAVTTTTPAPVTTTVTTTTPAPVTTTVTTTTPAPVTTTVTSATPVPVTTTGVTVPQIPYIKGDINSNGTVNAADITALSIMILKSEESIGSDINGDGKTDISDLVALKELILS